jgi:pimeloyl-ACP methyl ester carboxylesterase
MKQIPGEQTNIASVVTRPLGRRTFVKGLAVMGAGVAAYPLSLERANAASSIGHSADGAPSALASANSLKSRGAVRTDINAAATPSGEKTDWHGFDRFDFIMDESFAIAPFKAPAAEHFGVGSPEKGKRRCILVVPQKAAPGNPWSWRGCYWDHQPQTEIELLRRGFHVAYISADATLRPDKQWDAWYAHLTSQLGLSAKPAFVGMSRGGEYSYTWATQNADKVSCLYVDNPGMNQGAFMGLVKLAAQDVPILQVCGSIDPILGINATAIENIYHQFGGRISMMIKEGFGHHPHSLRHPKPIADFIEQSVQRLPSAPPSFAADSKSTKNYFYKAENSYVDYPEEGTHITCRGTLFNAYYERYAFTVTGTEAFTTVIVPQTAAPGMPWVFRAAFVDPNANVDLALLAKGFHIVTGPVGYNFDGPVQKHWDLVYQYLVDRGFAKKPAMQGAGGGAGEVYAWAIENPDKVSCIYAENPVMHSNLAKTQPLDSLEPLAKANVPLLHVCGSLDPAFKTNTLVVEDQYKKLGGQIRVIVKDNEGHYPLAPEDPKPVVDFIYEAAEQRV